MEVVIDPKCRMRDREHAVISGRGVEVCVNAYGEVTLEYGENVTLLLYNYDGKLMLSDEETGQEINIFDALEELG